MGSCKALLSGQPHQNPRRFNDKENEIVTIPQLLDKLDVEDATISIYPKAAYFNMLARGHWSIENQLHWNLDVTFLEDACRARKFDAVALAIPSFFFFYPENFRIFAPFG